MRQQLVLDVVWHGPRYGSRVIEKYVATAAFRRGSCLWVLPQADCVVEASTGYEKFGLTWKSAQKVAGYIVIAGKSRRGSCMVDMKMSTVPVYRLAQLLEA